MENLKIFKINNAKVDIEKLKETGGSLLGFFTKKGKKEVIDLVLYKSMVIFALTESYLIVYDILRECQLLDINELNKNGFNLIQIKIIHQVLNYFPKEMLICLCENNLIFMDLDNYLIKVNIELKSSSQKFYLEYTNDTYKIVVLHKYSFSVYEITIVKQLIKINKLIELEHMEAITNKNFIFKTNLIMFESKNKINIFKINYNSPSYSKYFGVFKKEISIYKNDLIINDSHSKYTDTNRELTFNYSKLTNIFYITLVNRIYLIKNSYSPLLNEEFEILEKITKQNHIHMTIVEDPYMFILIDTKVYIYFILDLNKCIEIVELYSSAIYLNSNIMFNKEINFLYRINKINLDMNLILYTDNIHLNCLSYKSRNSEEFILNSCQIMLMFYNSKSQKLEWIYSSNLEDQSRYLKGINLNFSSKLLSHYSQENNKLADSNTKFINEKFLLRRSLELFCLIISAQEYSKAKYCEEENNIDFIFSIILLKNFIPCKNLIFLIYYFYISNIYKYYDHEEIIDLNKELDKELEDIKNIICMAMLKNEKDLSLFLKTFFNKFITTRNEIKLKLNKDKRKKLNFDYLMDKLNEGIDLNNIRNVDDDQDFNIVKKNYHKIKDIIVVNNLTDDELRYAIIENLVFIFHFYSYRLSKNSKYTDNLKLMIKISHNILDKDLISLLKQLNLEEEILLFYYYKGNYAKCVSNIVSIYESLGKVKENDSMINSFNDYTEDETVRDSNSQKDDSSMYDFDEKINVNNILITNSTNESGRNLEKIKTQWLSRYINLISVLSDKLSIIEFYEYIKWALSKNPFKTIEILFENNKISKEILDLEFINLLKNFGIDPVIFYLKKFLKNNEACNTMHHNEMINLYTIKLKLLQEALDKENTVTNKDSSMNIISAQTSNYYKWNKKIIKTRDEFCNYLIDHKLYNLEFAYEKISSNPSLQLENGIVLVKQNRIEEGVFKIFYAEFQSKMRVIKHLIRAIPIFEIVYLTIKYIITHYNKNNQELKNILNSTDDLPVEGIIISILEEVKTEYNIIYQLSSLDIFDSLVPDKFLNFFIQVLSNIDSDSKNYKIESSLIEAKVITAYNNLLDVEKENIIIDNRSYCFKCSKGFFNLGIVLVLPKTLYHLECYQNLIEY